MDSLLSFLNQDDVKQIPVDILIKVESHLMAARTNSYEKDTKILEIRQELKAAIEKCMNLQMEYYEYRKESTSKFSKLSQTKERKIGELQSINSQLELQKTLAESQEKLVKEHAQSLQEVDIVNHLKQIQVLEDVNQMYAEIIDKYEIDNKILREDALNAKFQSTTEMKKMREEIEGLKIENEALEIRNKSEKVNQTKKQLDEQQSRFQAEIESLKRQNEREVEMKKESQTELMQVRNELEKWRTECRMLRDIHCKHNEEIPN